ncbi:MAG: hypothetical protein NTX38_07735 [Methylobacter sp.]|nr:hypothetical protein [Methylobacter sp.]
MMGDFRANGLAERFRGLWTRNLTLVDSMDAAEVYGELKRLYSQALRCYHDMSHLTTCLYEFDQVAGLIQMPDAVELALWFHDAIYLPGAMDNELQSAKLFSKCGQIAFAPEFVEKICRLILITMHKSPPQDYDESYIVDIDLASFGAEWSIFLQDSQNVRKEQLHLPDSVYYLSHAKFLKILLDRHQIFHTDFFRSRYEESARRNIERLLATSFYSG